MILPERGRPDNIVRKDIATWVLRLENQGSCRIGLRAGMNKFRFQRGSQFDIFRLFRIQTGNAAYYLVSFHQLYDSDKIRIIPAEAFFGHGRGGNGDTGEACQFSGALKLHPFHVPALTRDTQGTRRKSQRPAFLTPGTHDFFFLQKIFIGMIVDLKKPRSSRWIISAMEKQSWTSANWISSGVKPDIL